MLDRIVLHGEFSLFTVRGDFWYQIYRNRRKKVLCSRLSLITLTISDVTAQYYYPPILIGLGARHDVSRIIVILITTLS